jgi:hypothetical protein
MRTQSPDTSEQAERAQIALIQQAPIWRRLAALDDLNRAVRGIMLQGMRSRAHWESAADRRRRFVALVYGAEIARHAYGAAYAATSIAEEDIPLATVLDVTLLVTEQLEALDVPYLLGGSMASSVHGIFRSTNDADILADLDEARALALAQALQDQFYVDAEAIRDAVRRKASFKVIHLQSMFKVDIFLPGRGAFDQAQLARRQAQLVRTDPDRRIFVASPEDTVLSKLIWYRQTGAGSDRQWTDILGVLKVQAPTIDLSYLRRWATALSLTDLLDRALDDAGLAGN